MIAFAVLGFGLVIGWLARVVTPGRYRLTWAETAVVGIAGAGLGGIVANLAFDDHLEDLGPAAVLGSLAGAVVVLLLAETVVPRFGPRIFGRRAPSAGREPRAADLAAAGESERVEFKTSARFNPHTGRRDDRLEAAVVRTVAGFMNGEGGTLLVGVDDEGRAVGLDGDLSLVKRGDHDRYALWLVDLLSTWLGRPAATNVTVSFEAVGGRGVCRLDVARSPEPVFARPPKGERASDFYVRIGNSTRRLLTDEAIEYTRRRFG